MSCCNGLSIVVDNLTAGYITSVFTTLTVFFITCLVCVGSIFGLWRNPAVADERSETSVNDTALAGPSTPRERDVTELQESAEAKRLLGDDTFGQQIRRRAKNFNIQEALKIIEAGMTEDQKQKEKLIQWQQLTQIYEMLQRQPDKFGTTTLEDVEEQLKLYR